jgi:hypothetical protein
MRIINRITRWYKGELYITPPDSPVFVVNHWVRSKSAIKARKMTRWLKANYQWLIAAGLALLAIVVR